MALLASAVSCARETKLLVEGGTAADFSLETLTGEKITLLDTLKEKRVVLVFSTTWCPACKEQAPEIERFYQENKDKVAVIGINPGEKREKVEKHIQDYRISYPVVLDPQSEITRLYGIRGVPTIIAIDKEARIVCYGPSMWWVAQKIKKWLK